MALYIPFLPDFRNIDIYRASYTSVYPAYPSALYVAINLIYYLSSMIVKVYFPTTTPWPAEARSKRRSSAPTVPSDKRNRASFKFELPARLIEGIPDRGEVHDHSLIVSQLKIFKFAFHRPISLVNANVGLAMGLSFF